MLAEAIILNRCLASVLEILDGWQGGGADFVAVSTRTLHSAVKKAHADVPRLMSTGT
jgi:hypothetical protein